MKIVLSKEECERILLDHVKKNFPDIDNSTLVTVPAEDCASDDIECHLVLEESGETHDR